MKKILTHVHLYYAQMWREIKTCLANIGVDYDLFATLPADNESLRRDILEFKPDADVAVVENRGFDVAPFIDILNRVDLDDYDYIIKLHTKRDMPVGTLLNGFDVSGDAWRRSALRFLETRDAFARVLHAFETDDSLGMTGDYRLIRRKDERQVRNNAMAIIKRLGLPSGRYAYVAGTMFMARAKLFNPLKRLSLTGADFAVAKRGADPLPYAIERVFGYLVGAQGLKIKDPLTPAACRVAGKIAAVPNVLKKFFYRKKITAGGKVIIKICKIPVRVKKNRGAV